MRRAVKKKLLSLLCGLLLFSVLAGCQNNASDDAAGDAANTTNNEVAQEGPVSLTLWAEEDNFQMLEGMVESFKKKYPEQEFEITLAVQSDATLRDVALGDVHSTADVFHFPDDQLNSLIAGGVLAAVPEAEKIK